MLKYPMLVMLLICFSHSVDAADGPIGDATRGELLYSTHCIACHTTQLHWRDKRLANDWGGLTAQVQHWQSMAGLSWSHEDIANVAQYLNDLYYHYPVQRQMNSGNGQVLQSAQR